MTETYAWLLERTPKDSHHPEYVMVQTGFADEAVFSWTTTAYHALRFARREDAAFFGMALRTLTMTLPVCAAPNGFRPGDLRPQPVEHGFFNYGSGAGEPAAERHYAVASALADKSPAQEGDALIPESAPASKGEQR